MSKGSRKRRRREMMKKIENKVNGVVVIDGVITDPTQHRVTLMQDHHLMYPEMFLEIYILGDRYEEAAFAPMFARARCKKATCIEDADLVVFTGGTDVDPRLYGAKAHISTDVPDTDRDDEEMSIYLQCLTAGIPMLGICRGAQFLHVMNGGKLYQHVDRHHGAHKMLDLRQKKILDNVSSTHHQMVMENIAGGMTVIATTAQSTNRWIDNLNKQEGTHADIEAFFYRDTCCIGVQGHPEYKGYNAFELWVLDLINECVCINPDVEWLKREDGTSHRRLSPEIIEIRDDHAPLTPLEPLRLPPPLTGSYHTTKGN